MKKRTTPWLTEGAIQFLEAYVQPSMFVLEFGAGASTRWLADRCNLATVEHDAEWLTESEEGSPWVGLLAKRPYNGVCDRYEDDRFSLILVDGRDRMLCVESSVRVLKPGGFLMLDNAERKHYHTHNDCPTSWDRLITEQHWNVVSSIQQQPDSDEFVYEGWTTSWIQKPEEA